MQHQHSGAASRELSRHQAQTAWPFQQAWPGCHFSSLYFDHGKLQRQLLPELDQLPGNSKRQAEFVAGRICARHALRQFLPDATAPAYQPDSRVPVWPRATCGSISHSHGHAVAVAASQQHWLALGLDIERMIAPQRAARLCGSLLTTSEQDIQQRSGWPLPDFLTCAFSAKESLFKLLNPLTGSYFGFQDAELVQLATDGSLRLQLRKQLGVQWPAASIIAGQWARFGQGFVTITGVAAEPTTAAPELP